VRHGRKALLHYFSCLGETGADPTKSAPEQVMPNLCFCIRWDLWVRSAFCCVRGAKCRRTIFHAPLCLVRITQKPRLDMLLLTCVFAFGGICWPHIVSWCIRGVNFRCTIFHGQVGPVQIPIKVCMNMSRSVFWCVWGTKLRCTIFQARVGMCGSHKKRVGTH
jgi:hypothetical protein